MDQIKSAAETFVKSYETAIALGRQHPSISTSTYAQAIAAHYGPDFTSYTSGHRHTSGSYEAEIASVKSYLDRLVQAGLGLSFDLVRSRVEVVCAHRGGGSALCYLTWRINPGDERDAWEWENVYAFRLLPQDRECTSHDGGVGMGVDADGGRYVVAPGHWEFVVSDNELEELVKRVPTIFTDTFGEEGKSRASQ